jgi:hypothetical protein
LTGRPEQQTKGGSDGTEFRRRPEGDVDLQGLGEQEDSKEGVAAVHVHVMNRPPLAVHPTGPVSNDLREIRPTSNAQRKVDIGPAVFGSQRLRASQRGTNVAWVGASGCDEAVAESGAILGCEHGGKYSSARDADQLAAQRGLGKINLAGVDWVTVFRGKSSRLLGIFRHTCMYQL